jgi:hypothetical protein
VSNPAAIRERTSLEAGDKPRCRSELGSGSGKPAVAKNNAVGGTASR